MVAILLGWAWTTFMRFRGPQALNDSLLGPLRGRRRYDINQLSNTVSVIKTATNTVVTTVPVGVSPVVVAMVRR